MSDDQIYDSNAKSTKDGTMIITKAQTEPLTISLLNALLANFATGTISLDELWSQIDQDQEVEDVAYFRHGLTNPIDLPECIKNRMSGPDTGAGI